MAKRRRRKKGKGSPSARRPSHKRPKKQKLTRLFKNPGQRRGAKKILKLWKQKNELQRIFAENRYSGLREYIEKHAPEMLDDGIEWQAIGMGLVTKEDAEKYLE